MQTEHLSPGPTAHLHARSVAPGPVTPRLCHGGRPVHGFMDVVCFSCGLWFYAHYLLTLSLRAGLALRSLTRHVVQTHTYMRACVRTHTHTHTHTHTPRPRSYEDVLCQPCKDLSLYYGVEVQYIPLECVCTGLEQRKGESKVQNTVFE